MSKLNAFQLMALMGAFVGGPGLRRRATGAGTCGGPDKAKRKARNKRQRRARRVRRLHA